MAGVAIVLHILASTLWVGGMAFAYFVLHPALAGLDGPARLRVVTGVLSRFLKLALGSVLVLLVSGYVLLFGVLGGFGGAPIYVHVMHLTGWVMFLVFFHLFFAVWPRLRRAMAAGDAQAAAVAARQVRGLIGFNLAMGLGTVAIGTGRYWLS